MPTELDNFARAKLIVRDDAPPRPRDRGRRAGRRADGARAPVKIYFAGPLFTPAERRFIDECAAQLRAAGFDVFVPHEHELALDGTVTAERIFAKDWAALSEANAVLAILDGPVIDDGTACEIGIFYGLMQSDPAKKGIVGMTHDLRATRDSNREGEVKGLNLFVVGCIEAAGTIVTSLDAAQARARGLALRPLPLLLELPQLHASDLPAPRLRQLADELDLARVLVRRGHALAVILELRDELGASRRRRAAARRTPRTRCSARSFAK